MTSQPLAPMRRIEAIESIETLEPIPLLPEDNNVFAYDWDLFEQSLEWANEDYLNWVTDSSLSSPSNSSINSFPPLPNSRSQHPQSASTSPTSNPKLPHPQQSASEKPKPRRRQPSSESRARRRSQNREAQRAFRCRKQQMMEDVEAELRTMKGMYAGLAEKYENLNKLYMDLLEQSGGVGKAIHGLEENAMVDTFLKDWRMDDATLEGQRERAHMSSQEVDLNDLLFGSRMGTGDVGSMEEV